MHLTYWHLDKDNNLEKISITGGSFSTIIGYENQALLTQFQDRTGWNVMNT